MGGFGQIGEISPKKIYLYPFLSNSRTGQTAHHIFMLNGSNDADSRKGVPFWHSLILWSILGDQIAQKPQFWGRE